MINVNHPLNTMRASSDWKRYPYNQETYLPFREPVTEFGHDKILIERFSRNSSLFRVLEAGDDGILHCSDFCSESDSLDALLEGQQPLLRVFIFPRDHTCTSRSWLLASDDLKKIFSHYHVQPSFVQRLKSFKFSASPEIYRSYKSADEHETPIVSSHDLQFNINIPYMNHTIFCPSYYTYDTTSNTQVLLLFNDTNEELPAQKFSARLEGFIALLLSSRLYRQSLALNRFSLPVMISGLVAEGWTQCTRELREVQSDMEKMVQDTPDHNSWDLQKLFGHLSFRIPAMIAFRETLDLLKQGNAAFTSEHVDQHGGQMLVDDLVDHQLGLIRSVRRDFDYMRGRLEDLSALSFNLIAKQNSKVTAEIAEQNYRDAMSMRTIALVTLFFLPGTFIASFFSMSFFSNSDSPFLSRPSSSWLYFAVTIPLTACTVLVWTLWKRNEMNRVMLQRYPRTQPVPISDVPSPSPSQRQHQHQHTFLGPCVVFRMMRRWKLFHRGTSGTDFSTPDGALEASSGGGGAGCGTMSKAQEKALAEETIGDIMRDMEKQTPVWFPRSKAFAWKEDLELHWGDSAGGGGVGGARLRRQQLERTESRSIALTPLSERSRSISIVEGGERRGMSAGSAFR